MSELPAVVPLWVDEVLYRLVSSLSRVCQRVKQECLVNQSVGS